MGCLAQLSGNLQQRDRLLRNAADTQTVLSSVLLVGAGVSYDWSRDLKIEILTLDNLLNKDYQTNLGYLQPGREFKSGSASAEILNCSAHQLTSKASAIQPGFFVFRLVGLLQL